MLAVGTDDGLRVDSRGDSTFLDLHGCVVTALPEDLERADALVREATAGSVPEVDVGALLMDAGLLGREATLEPGSPADLAFWCGDATANMPISVATVRQGADSWLSCAAVRSRRVTNIGARSHPATSRKARHPSGTRPQLHREAWPAWWAPSSCPVGEHGHELDSPMSKPASDSTATIAPSCQWPRESPHWWP